MLGELFNTIGHGAFAKIVQEGLTIGGWVAMWRPLQIYLYDWWPLRAERRVLERLSRMSVRLVLPAGNGSSGRTA
jgi:cytidylate kinase